MVYSSEVLLLARSLLFVANIGQLMHCFIEGSRSLLVFLVGLHDALRLLFAQRASVVQASVGDRTDFLFHFGLAIGQFLPILARLLDDAPRVLPVAVLLVQGEAIRRFARRHFVVLEPPACRFEQAGKERLDILDIVDLERERCARSGVSALLVTDLRGELITNVNPN